MAGFFGAKAPGNSTDGVNFTVGGRTFMTMGAWYQNEKGSLTNHEDVPVSVKLHIFGGDQFHIKIEHLSSNRGTPEGWFSVNGTFQLSPLPKEKDLWLVGPKHGHNTEVFGYNREVLTMATCFVLRCMELSKGAAMAFVRLKADIKHDRVLVTPHPAIHWVWRDHVALHSRREEELWTVEG